MKEVVFDRHIYFVLAEEFNKLLCVSEEEIKLEFEDCDCSRSMQVISKKKRDKTTSS